MVVTPLTFLGGAFYSINMLPPVRQKIALFNPVRSDQRILLELLRHLRRQRRRQRQHDDGFFGAVPRGGVVDLQDGVQAQGVSLVDKAE